MAKKQKVPYKKNRKTQSNKKSPVTSRYNEFLNAIKETIRERRIRAYRIVNRELIDLYLTIGQEIAERQEKEGWGKSVVEQLSKDLKKDFPGTSGFSTQNLWFMRQIFLEYQDHPNLLQLVREIPWGQNITIVTKIKELDAREYYLHMTLEMGWSRNVLIHQIKADAYHRHKQIPKLHNFNDTLPVVLAEQADDAMKDVYALDFLGITKPVLERELERRMVNRIRDVMLEFGQGFAFIGNQFPIKMNEKEYFIDLLFYQRKLQCLVAVELKVGEFKPEYAGKMNFYLNILNEHVREPHENPSIGIILCTNRNRLEVEYSLKGIDKPVGVAEYSLTNQLPSEFAGKIPQPDELEKHIISELGGNNNLMAAPERKR